MSHSTCEERLRLAEKKFAAGNVMADADDMYALYVGEGDFAVKTKQDREVLGLRLDDVDSIVQKVVELGPFSVM